MANIQNLTRWRRTNASVFQEKKSKTQSDESEQMQLQINTKPQLKVRQPLQTLCLWMSLSHWSSCLSGKKRGCESVRHGETRFPEQRSLTTGAPPA